jgi:hypothetical protein
VTSHFAFPPGSTARLVLCVSARDRLRLRGPVPPKVRGESAAPHCPALPGIGNPTASLWEYLASGRQPQPRVQCASAHFSSHRSRLVPIAPGLTLSRGSVEPTPSNHSHTPWAARLGRGTRGRGWSGRKATLRVIFCWRPWRIHCNRVSLPHCTVKPIRISGQVNQGLALPVLRTSPSV